MLPVRRAFGTTVLRAAGVSTVRPLSTTATLSLKESSSRESPDGCIRRKILANFMTETDEDYDKHKQESLLNQKRGKGEWKRELASDSEEAVKAERDHGHEDIATLQKRTKDHADQKRRG